MDIRFQAGGPSLWKADVVLTFVFKGEQAEQACPVLVEAAPWLSISPVWRDFKGTKNEFAPMYGVPTMDVSRVLVAGLGAMPDFKLHQWRETVAQALRHCRNLGAVQAGLTVGLDMAALERVAKCMGQPVTLLVREAVLAAQLGLYRYDQWRTEVDDRKPDPRALTLLLTERHVPDEVQEAARLGEAEAAGICLARDLANGPANSVTPTFLAERAQNLVKDHKNMSCTVLGPAEIEELGMHSFLSVAQGSRQEARLIVLEYHPENSKGQQPVVFVGKGITFDSGGICLKPSANMAAMKGDMGGAAAIVGLFESLAQLPVPANQPVIGILPCTENMPDGQATRPGDVVKTMNGKSVEIINTDAEGRLVLIDALTYAQKNWKPALLLDIATLTGACVVALGTEAAGLFCNDEALSARLVSASAQNGERLWPLPLWDNYKEAMKSEVADLANSGPREGGAIYAAVFLQQFVNPGQVWAHLDIAGSDSNGKTPLCPKGSSGFGVRSLLALVQ